MSGTMVIGHDRHTRAHIGSRRTTSADGISLVSGKAVAAPSRTTIDGIEIAPATNVAVLRATTTTIGTTDIADARDERRILPAISIP